MVPKPAPARPISNLPILEDIEDIKWKTFSFIDYTLKIRLTPTGSLECPFCDEGAFKFKTTSQDSTRMQNHLTLAHENEGGMPFCPKEMREYIWENSLNQDVGFYAIPRPLPDTEASAPDDGSDTTTSNQGGKAPDGTNSENDTGLDRNIAAIDTVTDDRHRLKRAIVKLQRRTKKQTIRRLARYAKSGSCNTAELAEEDLKHIEKIFRLGVATLKDLYSPIEV
ncbi:hypothetical protein BJ508DRAFT_333767 [Ascobolus immersus RN42]|uniref:Uncharacterized protein n=1 Tax=Ascobolus immersus RN42 TaxID=1160509 RepID=A0A3N4HIG8_ASCIM|nr:hypothetical protein BJ508DRAFT_333767 [Ascobolus immersus RN42]